MLHYGSTTIGTMRIKQGECTFDIQIRQGNCLAVLIHARKSTPEELEEHPEGKYVHTLYNFFADAPHMARIIKNEGRLFFDEVKSIKLNTYYKECFTLLKYFNLAGHKVTCFYEAPKK